MNHPIVVGITGASGAIYAVRLLDVLRDAGRDVHLTISTSGRDVIQHELKLDVDLDHFDPSRLRLSDKESSVRTTRQTTLLPLQRFHGPHGQRLVHYRRHGDLPLQRHNAQCRSRRGRRQSDPAGRRSALERAAKTDSSAARNTAVARPHRQHAPRHRSRRSRPARVAWLVLRRPLAQSTWSISSSPESAINSASSTHSASAGEKNNSRRGTSSQDERELIRTISISIVNRHICVLVPR